MRRSIWKVIRIVWVSAGIIFMLWLYDSFRARGVAESTLQSTAQITVTETDEAIIFAPAQPDAAVGLVFFHGGGVEPRAYAPLIRAVAESGFQAAIVKLPYRFAPLESHRREAIQRALQVFALSNAVEQWVVAGHSKGGKLASELVRTDASSVAALVLIATSHPKDFDLSHLEIPVKKIYATQDGVASVSVIESTRHNLPMETEWMAIEGGNHAQFGHYGKQLFDGRAAIDRSEQQRITLEEIRQTLAAVQARIDPE